MRDGRKQRRRRGEIKEIIFGNVELFIQILEQFFELGKSFLLCKIAARVVRPLIKPFKQIFIDVLADKFVQIVIELRAKFVACHFLPTDADDGKIVRQKFSFRQIIKCGKQVCVSLDRPSHRK